MIFIVVPVFNEEANVIQLINNLDQWSLASGEMVTIVFADDGSSDQTEFLITTASPVSIKLVFLKESLNQGPGMALNSGFNWVLNISSNPADIVVTIEADNTSDLTILETMIALSRLGYPMVLASVYAMGGGLQNVSYLRTLLSSLANRISRQFLGLRLRTLSSFYRVYQVQFLRQIKTNYGEVIANPAFTCMLEILVKAKKMGVPVIEVPTTLNAGNRVGRSKMKIINTCFAYFSFFIWGQYHLATRQKITSDHPDLQ